MRKITILFFSALIVTIALITFMRIEKNSSKKVPLVNFETSMGGPDCWEYKLMLSREENKVAFRKYEAIYYDRMNNEAEHRKRGIPKVIHQIWIGPKSPPAFFEEYRRSWLDRHPGWEFRLWTDKEASQLKLELQQEYDASTNWGEKSDILRAEILDQYGGVYVDVDFECLSSFDWLAERFDFFAGIEPPHEGVHPKEFPRVTVSNALIGSCPHHPIITAWKKMIQQKWNRLEEELPDCKKRVLERTFYTFGEAVFTEVDNPDYISIVFPTTYFYPLTFSELSKGRRRQSNVFKTSLRSLLYLFHLKERPHFSTIESETMAVHYWGGSWQKGYDEQMFEMRERVDQLEHLFAIEILKLKKEIDDLQGEKKVLQEQLLLSSGSECKKVIKE